MSDDMLQEIACPKCLNPIDIRQHGRHVTCDACNSQFLLTGHVCPYCQTYHAEEEAFCRQCGEAMNRTCRSCYTVNWAGDEFCQKCGGRLDMLELIHAAAREQTYERQAERREMIINLKKQEEVAANKRTEHFRQKEAERQAELQQRQQAQKSQENLMLAVGFIAMAVILIILIALFLL